MKAWLAAAVLLACFALALSLLAREHASAPAVPLEDPGTDLPAGWGSVVLGAPSGSIPPAAEAPVPQPQPEPEPVAPTPSETEVLVAPGQSLSTICKAHYGTASVALVEALARYNALKSPDALRSGQTLKLPPLETLQKP